MNQQTQDLVDVRFSAPYDSHQVCGTWLPGLYYGNYWFKEIYKQAYFEKYLKVIQAILMLPGVYVNSVTLKEDKDVILSYAVIGDEDETLHWVYTKPSWRKLGLAKAIIPETIHKVTHLTRVGKNIKPEEWIFDPFL